MILKKDNIGWDKIKVEILYNIKHQVVHQPKINKNKKKINKNKMLQEKKLF